MGQSYLLGCPEGGEARLLDAVERVDTAMCKIRDAGKVKARDRIAVLAALNLAFDISDRAAPSAQAVPAGEDKNGSRVPPAAEQPGDSDLSQLLERLDKTLADDGRLL